MKWENLKTFTCPHCGKELTQGGEEIQCTQCRFKIEYERYKAILTHRSSPEATIVKMRWQNLKESKCPMCSNQLIDAYGKYRVLKCISSECTFKIREDRMSEIINDQTHPANRFYNPVAEEEKNQKALSNI